MSFPAVDKQMPTTTTTTTTRNEHCQPERITHVDHQEELFQESQLNTIDEDDRAGWLSHLLYGKQHGFGTWDGVFTTVVINTFGITVFLRTGWVVANAGIGESVLILLLGILLAIIPVLSAIEICERCQIQSGGVYFLVSHVLGAKIGGAVGIIFILGQIVANSMVAVGFGESMASLINVENIWVSRGFALGSTIILLGVNVAGIKWVIRTQIALLCILILAVCDFLIGALATRKPEFGVLGMSSEVFVNNSKPDYEPGENFFTVFGVYFSTFTGILSGVNMSGDLKDPVTSIPLGELAGLGVSVLMALAFILSLGSIGERSALHLDINFVQKASLTGFLLLGGIYVSSLSAIISGLYVSPRLLQSIAAENVIGFMKFLVKGRGPNKEPVYATVLVTILTLIFIFIGSFNLLAKIATLPYLMMYAFINYSYFSLAMTYDLVQLRQNKSTDYGTVYKLETDLPPVDGVFPSELSIQPIVSKKKSWYSYITNRWLALIGAAANIMLIFFIDWKSTLILLAILCLIYFYIGQTNPGVSQGGISQFSVVNSFKFVLGKSDPTAKEQPVIPYNTPEMKTEITQVTASEYNY
ncbi:Solute carrier family 12 member 8 [Trichinella papuae]|uniref:Solute carrier family 12 member 9 n=1 Tax=Trichinella papuae TaxID=268474 RepID=A0A0V1MEV3_9BILA|nr:Solute carrier family 12 member 8 [Trichinella papuae]